MGVGIKSKRKLNSWDKFQVPNFFSSVKVIYSDPIIVNSKLSFDETSKIIEECDRKLNELQKEAETF